MLDPAFCICASLGAFLEWRRRNSIMMVEPGVRLNTRTADSTLDIAFFGQLSDNQNVHTQQLPLKQME